MATLSMVDFGDPEAPFEVDPAAGAEKTDSVSDSTGTVSFFLVNNGRNYDSLPFRFLPLAFFGFTSSSSTSVPASSPSIILSGVGSPA